MKDLKEYLAHMISEDASDIYFTVGLPPVFRIEGITFQSEEPFLTADETQALALSIMNERQRKIFEQEYEMNLALYYPELGRFRVNIFRQRGCTGLVFRQIKVHIQTIDDLGLPQTLKEIVLAKRGLVLVVGATGSGKSTTLAAMLDYRNTNQHGHIVTIEDPIEFVHEHKKSIVTQREVGFDTHSFFNALKNMLRQAPDVILIGEIRDSETMDDAITFAETGHLCLATLHSNNANQAMERILNFFPVERHLQIFMQLSLNLKAIISQRLVPGVDGRRVAAFEILLDTPRVKDLILKGAVGTLKEAMGLGDFEGMRTFDQDLYRLYKEGRIDYKNALAHADSANDLRLKIKIDEMAQEETRPPAKIRLESEFTLKRK